MDAPLPDLVVSIDFGMTCTGVAYQNLSVRSETVQWINKWPGRSQAAENKVPTVLVYPTSSPSAGPTSWGFQSEVMAEQLSEDRIYREWFKVLLDGQKLAEKQQEDPNTAPKSMDEVKRWYTDYMRKLYDHIEYKLAPGLGQTPWPDATIEFIFSVPTTWSTSIVERFRGIIGNSGFGGHRNHSVMIDLTEAEAVAVFQAKDTPGIFRPRDILLVCDAGGGTTDLSVLRVLDTSGRFLRLEQLDVVQGRTIGSTAIDRDFQTLVRKRLEDADKQSLLNINKREAAWEMMKSKEFQNVKCEVGSPDEPPRFKLPVRGLRSDYKDLLSGIVEGGFMTFTREELRELFDRQIDKMFQLIDQQVATIERKFPNEQIAHLVLSGGLGNSGYVHQKLAACYQSSSPWNSARHMQVRISPDPQLAVCKGMIVNRVQKLRSDKSAIGVRCCRASYGSLCKELYNPADPHHAFIRPETDHLNGKQYVTNVVEWYVRKGEPIDSDEPIVCSYKRRVPPTDSNLEVATTLVRCDLDARMLPYTLSKDVRSVCDLRTTIPATEGILHKESRFSKLSKTPWKKGRSYIRIDFDIKIIIGPADLRFELWRNGLKMGGERSIKVDFAPANDYVPPPRAARNSFSPTSPTKSPRPMYPSRPSFAPQDTGGLIPVTTDYYTNMEKRTSHIAPETQYHELSSTNLQPVATSRQSLTAKQPTGNVPTVVVTAAEAPVAATN